MAVCPYDELADDLLQGDLQNLFGEGVCAPHEVRLL
jgi:hypothetical protein